MKHQAGCALVTSAIFLVTSVPLAYGSRRAPPPPPAAKPLHSVGSPLEQAIQLYQNAQFGESIGILDKLLRQGPDQATRKQAKLYLAMNFLALSNTLRATSEFHDLLDLDPDFELPSLSSPSLRSFFNKQKAGYRVVPEIGHTPPLQIEAAQGVELRFELRRMRPHYAASLYYRTEPRGSFSRIELTPFGDKYLAQIPVSMLLKDQGYRLEYYAVVVDGNERLASARDADTPYSVPVAVPIRLQTAAARPVYRAWWFWTSIAAAIAVAGGVTAYVLSTRAPPATTGSANVGFNF